MTVDKDKIKHQNPFNINITVAVATDKGKEYLITLIGHLVQRISGSKSKQSKDV